jgi:hypothetical protein
VQGRLRRRAFGGALSWVAVVVALSMFAPIAQGADEHSFEPVRSLRGDTSTSADDPVPDAGSSHPGAFASPCGTTTDRHGYIYVATSAPIVGGFGAGRVDIFDPAGNYLTHIPDADGPCGLAVDSAGNVYVFQEATHTVEVFAPGVFPPAVGTAYTKGASPTATGATGGVAAQPLSDHVFVTKGSFVAEYDSKANGSALLDDTIGTGALDGRGPIADAVGVDVCAGSGDVYVTSSPRSPYEPDKARIYILSGATGHALKHVIDGSTTPDGGFAFTFGRAHVAVDQSNCDVYVTDIWAAHQAVDQFDSEGDFIVQIKHNLKQAFPFDDVAVDAPAPGQLGYDSPNEGYVFVTSANSASKGDSHLYAFRPGSIGPPEIRAQAASSVTEGEAVLAAEVNPSGALTTYRFEYVTQAQFDANEYAEAAQVPAAGASAGEGGAFLAVSEVLSGLLPDTTYRFRLTATNAICTATGEAEEGKSCDKEGEDASFTTYPTPPPTERSYELVTPPETNGRMPTAAALGDLGGLGFPTSLASPNGSSLWFAIEGGAFPGFPGSGFNDAFVARRGSTGWSSAFAGLTGAQAEKPYPGGVEAEHRFSFWAVDDSSASFSNYLRRPDGGIEPIGLGSLGADIHAEGRWISAGGGHVIFVTGLGFTPAVRLEPNAPAAGIRAIYDRAPGGQTHVVSLLPGEVIPTEHAGYLGASKNGNAIAFEIGTTIYERIDNARTVEVAEGATYAGIAADGDRVFYLKGGDVFSFDSASETSTSIGSGGESTVVNISADGSHVYFVSPKQLDPAKESTAGADNLYAWSAAGLDFIATVEHIDVTGVPEVSGGLGLWVSDAVSPAQARRTGPANDTSRTTPDGSVLVFESTAPLTGYENEGHREIYRYEAGGLTCISCNPAGVPPQSDSELESYSSERLMPFPPVNALSAIENVTADGERVFFQSRDPLVVADLDGKQDVYEWRSSGSPSCGRPEGCISLISGGTSLYDDYLYGMTSDGHDVFFQSADLLVPQDTDTTPSIYDARVGGGFPVAAAPRPCQGNDCQGTPAAVPTLTAPASNAAREPAARRLCLHGKKKGSKARRAGKRCHRAGHKHKRRHHKQATRNQAGTRR